MHETPKTGVIAALLAAGALIPTGAASADVLTADACPDGYFGVVVGVTTDETGQRRVYGCVKRSAGD